MKKLIEELKAENWEIGQRLQNGDMSNAIVRTTLIANYNRTLEIIQRLEKL